MKMITRDTDYAIRAVSCMAAGKKKMVTVTQLSMELDMPKAYLRKILQKLSKAGVLKSSKGTGGGFSLVVKPEKITILSIQEVFQGDFMLNEHLFKGKTCPRIKTCLFKKKLDKLEKYVEKELKAITISSLV